MEELARLENPENASDGKIRVKMPNKKVNEMFALASQILGGRRVTVLCEDGETRMARIPGKMRRRQWVREGDLILVWPWDFQDSKADVKHRYTKTQAMYLSRKGVLPDDVDMFGMGANVDDDGEHDDLFASGSMDEEEAPAEDDADDSACGAIEKCLDIADKVIFCNGGDRQKGNTPELERFKDNSRVVFEWGVGGDDKMNSSSWILHGYFERQRKLLGI